MFWFGSACAEDLFPLIPASSLLQQRSKVCVADCPLFSYPKPRNCDTNWRLFVHINSETKLCEIAHPSHDALQHKSWIESPPTHIFCLCQGIPGHATGHCLEAGIVVRLSASSLLCSNTGWTGTEIIPDSRPYYRISTDGLSCTVVHTHHSYTI